VNRKQLAKVLYIADHTAFGDKFALLAGELADAVHKSKTWGDVPTDAMHAAALFKWQALRFNGTWDQEALEECFEWLKKTIMVLDIDSKYEEVKSVVESKAGRGHEALFHLDIEPTDSRFKLLEA
jgi:hypothetical protein